MLPLADYRVLILLIAMLSSSIVIASPFPLTCHAIPQHTDKLCLVITEGALGPFDDAAIYRQNARGHWTLLHTYKDDVSTFDDLGFSKDGKLMWMSWAEEGHPTLSFYRTEDYLTGEAKALDILDEYGFVDLIELTNQGQVIYTVMQEDGMRCPNGKSVQHSVCEKTLQLNLH